MYLLFLWWLSHLSLCTFALFMDSLSFFFTPTLELWLNKKGGGFFQLLPPREKGYYGVAMVLARRLKLKLGRMISLLTCSEVYLSIYLLIAKSWPINHSLASLALHAHIYSIISIFPITSTDIGLELVFPWSTSLHWCTICPRRLFGHTLHICY